ncbi:dehydrogenase/reductase SDR family member on chromosome X-like [Meleagris gallopavo]|uniref:dehydrogenase/reductase SDR family member on chromosome X-like n=1 Tax=Meleagris gallopavo TaxID=9103 RepID=UPI0012AB8C1C|nr:dehydrogenase/reductase SDR family member on chromosome X-like [Meleagris gallopavo]
MRDSGFDTLESICQASLLLFFIAAHARVLREKLLSFPEKTPEEGASTTIYAAVSPDMEGVGGCYLYNEERTKSADVAYDEELQRRLWTESCKMVGISDESSRAP